MNTSIRRWVCGAVGDGQIARKDHAALVARIGRYDAEALAAEPLLRGHLDTRLGGCR